MELDASSSESVGVSTITCACPFCNARYSVERTRAGEEIVCASCNEMFPLKEAPAVCASHPEEPVVGHCGRCGVPVCETCRRRISGLTLCAECVNSAAADEVEQAAPQAAAVTPLGVPCTQHANVMATRRCRRCGCAVCETCAFLLPGDAVLCPACVTLPPTLSSRRRRNLIWSFLLAALATVAIILLIAGAFAQLARDPIAGGIYMTALVLLPYVIGSATAFSSQDRRLHNPWPVWAALAWNGLGLVLCAVFVVIGVFMS